MGVVLGVGLTVAVGVAVAVGVGVGDTVGVAVALGVEVAVGVAVAVGVGVGVGVGVPPQGSSHLPAFTTTRPHAPAKSLVWPSQAFIPTAVLPLLVL